MKTNRLISIFFVVSIVINIATAITTSEETSSVSRIVGESPTEMLRQMQRNEIALTHATYYSNDNINNKKDNILGEQFGSNVAGNMQGLNDWLARYSFNDVQNSVKNFRKNELFVIESDGNGDPLSAKSSYGTISPIGLRSWQLSFETNNPLMLWDSPYAGSYLPKEDTFVSRLVRDTTIIAPTSFNSPEFTKSFLCKLVNDKTIGQVFKEARNFHYNGGSKTSGDNLIGLVLQSYALYGSPKQRIKMDWNNADLEKIKQYCNVENLAPDIDYLGQVGNYSKFRKHVVFEIPSYTIESNGNYSIINTQNTFHNLEFGELVLPIAVRTTHFPLNTLITNFSVDYIGDYVDLTVTDLPSYEQELVNRTCYTDNESHSIQFENSYTENSQDFIARISPVQIVNCTQGRFRLYKKFNYSVDYIALSPILIKSIVAPIAEPVNSIVNVSIELLPLTSNASNGSLAIFDENNNKLWEQETTTNITNYNASFIAPSKEGLTTYSVEFIVNNETLNFDKFSLLSILLDVSADIPVHVNSTHTINLNFYSFAANTFELKGKYYLAKGTQIIAEGSITKTINQGINLHQIVLSNLLRKDQSYTLTLELNYLGQDKTLSYLLNTNNVPILFTNNLESYIENDTVVINYTAIDYDNDALNITINDSKFVQKEKAFLWKTNKGDEGNYSVKITANDNLTQDSNAISFSVLKPAMITSMKIESLNIIYNLSSYIIFEFVILNDASSTITDIQWQFDTGDNNTIQSNGNITFLSPGERAFVIVEYNYPNNGIYNVSAKAIGIGPEPISAQLILRVNISDLGGNASGLAITKFDAVSIIGTKSVFEIQAQNVLNQQIDNLRWQFSTGDGKIINSTVSFSLAPNETITLIVENNYASASIYSPSIEVTNGIYTASKSKSITINAGPKIFGIPNVKFNEDTYNDSIDLDNYVNSSEPLNNLVWTTYGNINVKVKIDSTTHVANFTAAGNFSGSENITFIVNDSSGLTDDQTILVTVNPVNDAPLINSFSPSNLNLVAFVNSSIIFNHTSSDVDNDALSYKWLVDGVIQSTSQSFEFKPLNVGVYVITLNVSDSEFSAIKQWNVTALNQAGIAISSFKVASQSNYLAIFEFVLNNTSPNALSNVSLALNTGTQTINSNITINLIPYESIIVYAEYRYNTPGLYTASVSATDGVVTDLKSLQINITEPSQQNQLNITYLDSTIDNNKAIFEFDIKNIGTTNLSGVAWTLNTGTETISSNAPMNLEASESAIVMVEYLYNKTGKYEVSASASAQANYAQRGSTAIINSIVHPVIKVENLTEVYAYNTFKIFQFALKNEGSQILSNVNWDFVINGTIAFNSSQPMELKPSEAAIVMAEYNFSAVGVYGVGVSVHSS